MTHKTQRYDNVAQHMTRRRALASGAALLTAGGTLVVVGGERTRAAVTVDSFDVSNASFTSEGADPVVDVTAKYEYDAGNSAVDELVFALDVDGTEVVSDSLVTDRSTLSGETTLSGRVTDSDAWAASDFAPAVADSVERTFTVTLRFAVVESDDSVIVEDSASDSATVTVSHPQESEYIASVGGSGTIRDANS